MDNDIGNKGAEAIVAQIPRLLYVSSHVVHVSVLYYKLQSSGVVASEDDCKKKK